MEIFAFTMTFLAGIFAGGNGIFLIAHWIETRDQKKLNEMPPPNPEDRVENFIVERDDISVPDFVN